MGYLESASFKQFNEMVARGSNSEAAALLPNLNIASCPDLDTCTNILDAAQLCNEKPLFNSLVQNIPAEFKTDFGISLKIAELYAKFDDNLNAIAFYKNAENIRPYNAWAYFLQGRYLFRNKRFDEAVSVLGKGLATATETDSGKDILVNLQKSYIHFSCFAGRADIRYGSSIINRHFHDGRALENALFIGMVKDEGDIIFESLRSAYRTGFRNFFIANNGSTDQTESEIRRFVSTFGEATVVIVADPIFGFWQAKKMNAFWRFAVEYFAIRGTKIDWIFPVDGDEMIVQADPARDLYGFLNSAETSGKTLLFGMWCNATPNAIQDDWGVPGDIDKSFPVVSGYSDSEHASAKVAFRVSATAQLEDGNHFATCCVRDASTVASLNDQGIFLLHHPVRSRRQFRSKIVNGMKGLQAATTLDPSIGHHWRVTFDRYAREGDDYIDLVLRNSFESNKIAAECFAREVLSAQGGA